MKFVRLIALFALTLCSIAARAAVTSVGTPTSDQGNSGTPSVASTVPAGTDVSYICIFAGGDTTISSMNTFGGVAPGLVGDFGALHLYRVVSPSAGATTAQGSLSASAIWSIHVIHLDGADTADPDDTPSTGTNEEQTEVTNDPAISSATGDLVIGCGLVISDNIAASSGATLSTEEESLDGGFLSTAIVYEAGAASVVVGVSTTGSFGDNAIIAANVNAAGGGASGLLLRRRRN